MQRLVRWGFLLGCLLALGTPAAAQSRGFQLARYQPTPSGSWFFAVEHPYSSYQRTLAAGLTFDYGHNPLRYGESSLGGAELSNQHSIIENQLVAHLDLAVAIRDRVLLNVALPLVLLETGTATLGITPISGIAVSDPRLSATIRAYGQPDKDRFTLYGSVALWIPLRAITSTLPEQSSDSGVRLRAGAVVAGRYRSILWSATLGFLYRASAQLGSGFDPRGTSASSEVQLGLAAGYYFPSRRLLIGPELLFATSLFPSQAFRGAYSNLEILGGIQHNLAKLVQLGLALGVGTLSAPGTPDLRLLLRVAYAPLTRDRDQDGIRDDVDACPDQKGVRSDVPSNHGCPPIADRDCDGVLDSEDECPDTPEGRRSDPSRIGCPAAEPVRPLPAPREPPPNPAPPDPAPSSESDASALRNQR